MRAAAIEAPVLSWLIGQPAEEMTAGRAGSVFSSDQLAQLLFLQVAGATGLCRRRRCPPGRAGCGRRPTSAAPPVLRLLHGAPSRSWQLEELARAAAMSRTPFAVATRRRPAFRR